MSLKKKWKNDEKGMSKPYSVLPLKFNNLEKELYLLCFPTRSLTVWKSKGVYMNHVYCVSQLDLPLSGKAKEFIWSLAVSKTTNTIKKW